MNCSHHSRKPAHSGRCPFCGVRNHRFSSNQGKGRVLFRVISNEKTGGLIILPPFRIRNGFKFATCRPRKQKIDFLRGDKRFTIKLSYDFAPTKL